jgi:hypothetical protein
VAELYSPIITQDSTGLLPLLRQNHSRSKIYGGVTMFQAFPHVLHFKRRYPCQRLAAFRFWRAKAL